MTQPSQAPGAPIDAGDAGLAPTEPQQQGTEPAAEEPQDIASLPEWARREIDKARKGEAGYRTKYKSAEQQAQEAAAQRDKILSALGLQSDGTEAPNPEALNAQLQQFQADLWERTVENTVLRTAAKLGADADALLDSNRFLDSLAELPDDADMAAHIAQFVAANPKFQATPRPTGSSGGDFGGAPQQQPASLDAQIRAAEAKGDFVTARQLKTQKMLNR
jgi:hypothetical protein